MRSNPYLCVSNLAICAHFLRASKIPQTDSAVSAQEEIVNFEVPVADSKVLVHCTTPQNPIQTPLGQQLRYSREQTLHRLSMALPGRRQ